MLAGPRDIQQEHSKSVIQAALVPMVQVTSGEVVATEIWPVAPPAGTAAVCGLIVNEPDEPAWVTITKAPPTVMVPQRDETAGLGATVKFTDPLPAPEPGDATAIQPADAAAVQEHDPGAVTGTAPAPPAAPNDC